MSSFSRVGLVARREYLFNLRRRSFLFAVFGVPLFTFAMWFIIFAVMEDSENDLGKVEKVGVADASGLLDGQIVPLDAPVQFEFYADATHAQQALDDAAIGAYISLPAQYLRSGQVEIYSYGTVPAALEDAVRQLLLANLSQFAPLDMPFDRIQNPVVMSIYVNDTGRTLTEANIPALFFLPMIFALLFMMSSGVTSGFLMSGIVEEKTNRIIEVLVTSVSPLQLLTGKIIGLGLLGLTQLLIWGAAGMVLITVGQAVPFLNGIEFPLTLMLVFGVYFILSYFLLSTLMAGIGAISGSEQESRQYSTIISLLFIIPFFFIPNFIAEPNGTTAVVLTMIPFTAPMSILFRIGFGVVPPVQMVASLLLLFLTTFGVALASARVFKWAVLHYGRRPTLWQVFGVLRASRTAEGGEARL
jgi:ABC-2 type transport system permease protein